MADYQGPVPYGSSEERFRKTGQTVGGASYGGDPRINIALSGGKGTADSALVRMKRQAEQAEQERIRQEAERQSIADSPSFVSASGPTVTREMEKSTEPTYTQATGTAFRNALNFGTIGTQGPGTYFGNIFEPFSRIRSGEVDVPGETGLQPFISGRGTAVDRSLIGARAGYSTEGLSMPEIIGRERISAGETLEQSGMTPAAYATTVGEKITRDLNVKAQDEFEAEIAPIQAEYQYKIDEGFMAYDDAISLFGADTRIEGIKSRISGKYANIAEKDFDTSFEDFTTKRGISERRVASIKDDFDISSELKTGVLTAGTIALSTTPFGLAAVTGISLGLGSKDIQQGISQKDWMQAGVGVAEIGLGLYGVKQIGYKRSKIKFAGGDVEFDANYFGRLDVKEKFKDLLNEKTFFASKGPPRMVDDFMEVDLKGIRGDFGKRGIQENIDLTARAFQTGDDTVSMFGKGTRSITFRTIDGDIITTPKETFTLTSPSFPVVKSPAMISKGGIKAIFEDFTGAAGRTFISPEKGGFTTQRFVSASQETPAGYLISGGKQTKGIFRKGVDFGIPEYTLVEQDGKLTLGGFKWDVKPFLQQTKARGKINTITFIEKPPVDQGTFRFRVGGAKGSKRGGLDSPSDIFSNMDRQVMKSNVELALKQDVSKQVAGFGSVSAPSINTKQITKSLSMPKYSAPSFSGSIYAGKGQYELTSGGLTPPRMRTNLVTDIDFRKRQIEEPRDLFYTGTGGRIKTNTFDTFGTPSFMPRELFGTAFTQSPRLKIKPALQFKQPGFSMNNPSFDFSFQPITPKVPKGFLFGLPNLGYLEFPKGKARGRRSYERTPTLFALEFNIKGGRSVLEETGLVRRPILSSRRRKKRR